MIRSHNAKFSLLAVMVVAALSASIGYFIVHLSHAAGADINGDGKVDIADLSILASHYGQSGQTFSTGDLNGDGSVGIADLSMLATAWGSTVATCSGINVTPGSNIQALIDANPAGTTFCFAPGTYVLTDYVWPKPGDKLISTVRRGAIITGQDQYRAGIEAYSGPNGGHDITVQGFIIEHFVFPWDGTFPRSPIQMGDNWTFTDNEVRYSNQVGVTVGMGALMTGNFIHHNGRYGITAGPVLAPAPQTLIDNNEISNNNTSAQNDLGDAGGSKIIGVPGNGSFVGGHNNENIMISNNYVHDNYGMALWCDIDCDGVTFANNTVTNNTGIGIFSEISWNMKITGNTVSGNGSTWPNQLCYYGQIVSGYSVNVVIANNTVTAIPGTNGICASDGDRGTDPAYPTLQTGLYVHDNTEYLVANSIAGFVGREGVYAAGSNNRFVNNHYHAPNTSSPYFEWKNGLNSTAVQTWSAWQAAGQDTTGTFVSP